MELAARILFGFALLAFALVPLFLYGEFTTDQPLSTGLALVALFLFGLGSITSLTGLRYRRKYFRLREKYSELYESAKKLA